MERFVSRIYPSDRRGNREVDQLLVQEGIRRDGNLDYTCGIWDENDRLIATGSCYANTLRCLAVSSAHRGEGLLNQVMGHLLNVQMERGNSHVFLYTKPASAGFMEDLGFYEIARVADRLVFMENRRDGFAGYLAGLVRERPSEEDAAGIVMNANPFTLGHLHLVERAAAENGAVHLFVLSEEAGPIPFSVRRRLVRQGVAHLPNVICHDAGSYIISSATFPSYFLRDGEAAILTQAELDLTVFGQIARALGIRRRYVGQEPASLVTGLYNQVMARTLPELGIQCVQIPRLEAAGRPISASTVRQAIHDGRLEEVRDMLPESTYAFLAGDQGAAVRSAIQGAADVIHY